MIRTVNFTPESDVDFHFATADDESLSEDENEEDSVGSIGDDVYGYSEFDRGISIEDMIANAEGDAPKVGEWKDVEANWCKVYLSKGNGEKWNRAKKEIRILK